MPSTPIAISNSTNTLSTPQDANMAGAGPGSATSPASSLSLSPQTPFFPPPGLSAANGHPPSPPKPLSPPATNNGFFKWATAAATLGKSPPPPPANTQQKGFDIPTVNHPGVGDDGDHHEMHDSFEFGDIDDMRSRSWAKTRRAVSMSVPGPGPGANQSGITAMLSGFGATSPPANGPPKEQPFAAGANPMSLPNSGVLADKAARGQGVLRRLSMSGTSYMRPSFMSPPAPSAPNLTPAPAIAVPEPSPSQPPMADPGVGVQRAASVSGATGRGRRYSEGRKRGVSPMGERILRDHGHF